MEDFLLIDYLLLTALAITVGSFLIISSKRVIEIFSESKPENQ
ncbi:hypothetical protein MUS1_12000 [Marinomonas ushuaiensis DSM 15871]|uniref:Uncharacterized protein n=1 Tax=Marinomonas ushuaiensis DSM 15871 TaxID=1122207 RepID=X7E5M1_9GAMM|nr:hypothetical protein [Marinomonas ushuaiensis]ETX11170.1 hypothetical protein MUS1_12000 [Marinomonas ushuaiensis DSM 15871]